MPQQLCVVLSYTSYTARTQPTAVYTEQSEGAPGLTHIFRMCVWNAFSTINAFTFPSTAVEISGQQVSLSCIYLFHSKSDRLDATELDDFFVFFTLDLHEDTDASLIQSSLDSYAAKAAIVKQTTARFLLDELGHDFPGHRIFVIESLPETFRLSVGIVSAFYYYAWLLILRAERQQAMIGLSPNPETIINSAKHIVIQRIRILNIDRFFLTNDRTNDARLRDLCTRLVEDFGIRRRYERISRLHLSFESHLDNTAKLLQANKTLSLERMVVILTICNVPLAALSVFLAVNLPNSIYTEWGKVLKHPMTWVLVCLSFSIVPVVAILLKAFEVLRKNE